MQSRPAYRPSSLLRRLSYRQASHPLTLTKIESRQRDLKENILVVMDLDIQVIEHLVGLSVDQVGLVRAGCHLEVASRAATATDSMSQAVVIAAVQGSQSAVQSALAALEQESGLAELSYEASGTLRSPLCSLSSCPRRRLLAHRENAVDPSKAAGMGLRTVGTGRVE